MDNAQQQQASAQDSGVETECDIDHEEESSDSSESGVSNQAVNGGEDVGMDDEAVAPAVEVAPVLPAPPSGPSSASSVAGSTPATPEPADAPLPISSLSSSPAGGGAVTPTTVPLPPPSYSEDGYLGDCSSDGGNEKNFPMPLDKLQRLLGHRNGRSNSNGACSSAAALAADDVDPPAGLSFQNLSPQESGYQVLGLGTYPMHSRPSTSSSRKMRSTSSQHAMRGHSSWSHVKAGLAERKLRMAANMNNVEGLRHLLTTHESSVDPNCSDEHQRTALHMAAAKGYSEVVRVLLDHGAKPNQKDSLGNTPLHLAACTNHISVVTLLLRAGGNVAELDTNGRTPLQLAQSKLNLLRKNQGAAEIGQVRNEVGQILEMMREYLSKTGQSSSAYSDLLNSFSDRLVLHQSHDDINSDLQNLLDSLGKLQV